MEFDFDPDLEYQKRAIDSTVNLFRGQQNMFEEKLFTSENEIIKNTLNLSKETILKNMQEIQKKNDINVDDSLVSDDEVDDSFEARNFSIEMETGTGKTYVYIRTMYELFKKYGMSKFIVVVPSIAIREGVIKTLEQTKNHFEDLYGDVPLNYFQYDSNNLNQIKSFGNSNGLEVMVMTLQSINKDDNVAYQQQDKLFGNKPIDIIKSTNPILILDEPQNMESENSINSLRELNPLFALRYSATHRRKYNLLYRLTPVDAYKKGLVKNIEVKGISKENDFNTKLISVKSIDTSKKGPKAVLKIHKKMKSGAKIGRKTVYGGESLYSASKGIDNYKNIKVTEINAKKGYVEFSDGTKLYVGESTDTDIKEIQHIQIKETIKKHLEKSLDRHEQGIKVLSVFFIDEVANYTDEGGHIRKAFNKAFNELKNQPEYKKRYGDKSPSDVSGSYFSEYKSESSIATDTEAYDLIMKDKEKLLSLDEDVEFIFTHSALKEGWDSPNVFQICTLNNTVSEYKKRQEIGRGVRLPVNQNGERVKNDNINKLTVIANESYEDYVSKIQSEYDEAGYEINAKEKTKNENESIKVSPKPEIVNSDDFKQLWSKISPKTTFKTTINTSELISNVVEEINEINIEKSYIQIETGDVGVSEDEDKFEQNHLSQHRREHIEYSDSIPNIVEKIADETNLTRNTIANILLKVDNLDQVFKNPAQYTNEIIKKINNIKNEHVVNDITYHSTGENYDKNEIITELETYSDDTIDVENSVYEKIIYDSKGEKEFAKKLDKRESNITLYIKLPSKYKIPTPNGNYNPDWGIVHQELKDGSLEKTKLYLVRETKFVDDIHNIRPSEKNKIKCAKEHYKAIKFDNFKAIASIEDLL